MAPRPRKSPSPTKALVKPPLTIGKIDVVAVVGELRQLHEEAEDPSIERMPADEEVYSALLYAEKHADAPRRLTPQQQKRGALLRIRLWEYLRERADVHQARAVAEARAAGAHWAELAPALAVKAPSAAYNKAKRLQAAVLAEKPHDAGQIRRTPEAVIQTERRIAHQQEAERRAQEAIQRRHHLLVPVAQRLLEHRTGLVLDDDAEYWLDEVAEVLPHCSTTTQMVGLNRYLSAVVRALKKLEQRTARPVTTTDEARLALAAAVEFLAE